MEGLHLGINATRVRVLPSKTDTFTMASNVYLENQQRA